MNLIQQFTNQRFEELVAQQNLSDLDPQTELDLKKLLFTQAVELLVDSLPVAQQKLIDDADSLNFYCLDSWNSQLGEAISQRWEKTLLSVTRASESTNDPS